MLFLKSSVSDPGLIGFENNLRSDHWFVPKIDINKFKKVIKWCVNTAFVVFLVCYRIEKKDLTVLI